MKENSNLKEYSLGIVTKDKVEGSDYISVSPIEEMFLTDGLIDDIKVVNSVSSEDSRGSTTSSEVNEVRILTAKWLPNSASNRATAPDVYKNETVQLYRYADTDVFYWDTKFREPLIRRQETVRWMFSNLPKGLKEYDIDTAYWVEVSTRHKHIKIRTVKNDGEPYVYDMILDTNKGTFTLNDDIGNQLYLNSEEHRWKIINASGSFIDMHKTIMDIHTDDQINITTKDLNIDVERTKSTSSDHHYSNSNVHAFTSNQSYSSNAGETSISSSGNTSVSAGATLSLSAPLISTSFMGFNAIGTGGGGSTANLSVSSINYDIGDATANIGNMNSTIGNRVETVSSSTSNVGTQNDNINNLHTEVNTMNIPPQVDDRINQIIGDVVPGMITK